MAKERFIAISIETIGLCWTIYQLRISLNDIKSVHARKGDIKMREIYNSPKQKTCRLSVVRAAGKNELVKAAPASMSAPLIVISGRRRLAALVWIVWLKGSRVQSSWRVMQVSVKSDEGGQTIG